MVVFDKWLPNPTTELSAPESVVNIMFLDNFTLQISPEESTQAMA